MSEPTEIRISFGRGGWTAVDGLGLPGPLYLRFHDRDGRLRIGEMYLDSQGGSAIEAQDLAAIPLVQIEAMINAYWPDSVRKNLKYPGPDLSTLATYYAMTVTRTGAVRALQAGDWASASFAVQYVPKEDDQAALEYEEPSGETVHVNVTRSQRRTANKWRGLRHADSDFRLSPEDWPTDGLTDDFLSQLKRAYLAALSRKEHPNASIKEQLGGDPMKVSLKTVQRWVYTARQRGIMDPAPKPGVGG